MYLKKLLTNATGAALLISSGQLLAEDLNNIYSLAAQYDPQFRAAQAQYEAETEAPYQAWGDMMPQINGAIYESTTTGESTSSGATTTYDYDSDGYSLSLTQSIYNHGKFAQISQAHAISARALANYQYAQQELILRAAEKYFNVLAAQDNLAFTRAEKKSIAHQLKQTQQRFNVGLTAITDVHEAQARYDQSVAQDIAAENKLSISREVLREMTRSDHSTLFSLKESTPLVKPDPADVQEWVKMALDRNFKLIAARESMEASSAGISKARAGHYPNLEVVASKNVSDSTGGMFPGERDETTVKLQLSMNIFSGGSLMSKSREASYRHMQSKEQLEQARRATERQTRNSFLSVIAKISQVKALKQALASSETALKATTAGFKVGTRTTVDVLNSQRDLFRAKLNYALARYDYIMETLRLKQAAGTLSPQDLKAINAWLGDA
ncbi:MAG: TolC family outer membrane protein [Gammaproteobacteria bacterium]|nr:TolC family outer membrane protein [Gammaproteobacteria bacterium]